MAKENSTGLMDSRHQLMPELNSADAGARSRAISTLVASGDEDAVSILAEALRESNWPVCNELAEAIAGIGGDGARTALISALKARRHHIRSAAVKALVRLSGRVVREAIERLANDPSYEVRQDVAEALRRLDQAGEQSRTRPVK